MKKNQSSDTADGVAACRAMESMRPEADRVIFDPYAKLLLGDKRSKLVNSPIRTWLFFFLGNLKFPGFVGSLLGRVRFMNECIKECFPTDCTQLVILGAGYDMSAYCFQDILNKAKVFEVDHPSTQTDKLTKIKMNIENSPNNISYVPVDFEKDDLEESLIARGYVPSEKTLFIWEGVTYYLEKKSVRQTLQFVVENSGSGSKLAFDYYPPEIVDGTSKDKLGKSMYELVKKIGEPYKFGINVKDIDGLLREHRFSHIQKYSSIDIRNLYFHGDNKKRKVSDLWNFVCATT